MPILERFHLKMQEGMKRIGLVRSCVNKRPTRYETKRSLVNRTQI